MLEAQVVHVGSPRRKAQRLQHADEAFRKNDKEDSHAGMLHGKTFACILVLCFAVLSVSAGGLPDAARQAVPGFAGR